jgi:small subunit ribosomal protein S9
LAYVQQIQAVGRRKTSVARIVLRPGTGRWLVNGRELDDYFPRLAHRKRATEPLQVVDADGRVDVVARVHGGGMTGQADAIRLGVARAMVKEDEDAMGPLRQGGFLSRDPRKVERKKPGRPKARKRFQFSKR